MIIGMVTRVHGRRQAFIKSCAEELLGEGFVVYSELPGYLPPPAIDNIKPDILARNLSQRRVISVKSVEVYDRDSPELTTLREYSAKTPGVSFLVYTVDERGVFKLVESNEDPGPEE